MSKQKIIEVMSLDDIYRFMETGNPDNAPQEVVDYLQLLQRVHGMILRIDIHGSKQAVLKHIEITEGLSRYKADQVYQEAIEYFYSDDQTTVKGYKNFYAQKMEQVLNFMMQKMETVGDGEKIIKSIKEIATLRGCYNEEKDPIPDELLQKKIFVYDFDADKLGLPKVDRNVVKKFIEEKIPELPEKHKQRLFEEADIIPFKAFPDVKTDPRKN
jgi:hypothetical protein